MPDASAPVQAVKRSTPLLDALNGVDGGSVAHILQVFAPLALAYQWVRAAALTASVLNVLSQQYASSTERAIAVWPHGVKRI